MVSMPAASIKDQLQSFFQKQKDKEKEDQAKNDQAEFIANQSQLVAMYNYSI